jgi:hypothetical protein
LADVFGSDQDDGGGAVADLSILEFGQLDIEVREDRGTVVRKHSITAIINHHFVESDPPEARRNNARGSSHPSDVPRSVSASQL